MDGFSTYNGGMAVGVKPFQQTGTRTGEFFSGANTSLTTVNPGTNTAHTMQQTVPSGFRPSSVLTPLVPSPNGQSATTFERNQALNLYRQ